MKTLLIFTLVVGFLNATVYHANMKRAGASQYKTFRSKRTGSQPIYEADLANFVIEVSIGTPPQKFHLLLGVEFPSVFVVGRNCTSANCNGLPASGYTKHHYDERLSSSYRDLYQPFKWTFGAGDIAGNFSIDDLSLGELTAPAEVIGIATEVNSFFGGLKVDGMFGLGLPALPILNLAYLLDSPMFTIWVNPTFLENGLLTIGGTDPAHCVTEKIRWVNTVDQTDWHFQIDGFQLGSYNVKRKMTSLSVLGDLYSFGPQEYVEKMAATIGAVWDPTEYSYIIECSKRRTLSDLIFNINGIAYSITADAYIEDIGLGGGKCAFAFGVAEIRDTMWTFGSDIFRQYCHSYDVENRKIGFARQLQS